MVASWGGTFQAAQRQAYFEPFQELSGITVIEAEGPSIAQVQAMVDTGNIEWDVVEIGPRRRDQSGAQGRLLGTDRLFPLRCGSHPGRAALHLLGGHAAVRADHWLSHRRIPGRSGRLGRFLGYRSVPRSAHDDLRIGWSQPVSRSGPDGRRRRQGRALPDRHRPSLCLAGQRSRRRRALVGRRRDSGADADRQGSLSWPSSGTAACRRS